MSDTMDSIPQGFQSESNPPCNLRQALRAAGSLCLKNQGMCSSFTRTATSTPFVVEPMLTIEHGYSFVETQ